MFALALTAILVLALWGVAGYLIFKDRDDIGFSICMTFLGTGSVVLIFGVFGSALFGAITNKQEYHPYSWNIIAASDSSATTGRFGLFSGYIDSEFRYYYYYKDGQGGIRLSWVPANRSQIFEDAPEGSGSIETDHPVSHWNAWGYVDADDPHYKIHIPAGSVVQKYTMDLQ